MRRVVFDTTVLVSAFLRPGGLADELLTLAAEGQFELVLSSAIILRHIPEYSHHHARSIPSAATGCRVIRLKAPRRFAASPFMRQGICCCGPQQDRCRITPL